MSEAIWYVSDGSVVSNPDGSTTLAFAGPYNWEQIQGFPPHFWLWVPAQQQWVPLATLAVSSTPAPNAHVNFGGGKKNKPKGIEMKS